MTIAPDGFDFERSRAAVAVSCLRWLQYAGPTIDPARRAPRPEPSPVEVRSIPDPPAEPRHPLWDRWLDGGPS